MTVFIFIIESASEEIAEIIFEGKKIDNIGEMKYLPGMDISDTEKMVSEVSERFNDDVSLIFIDLTNSFTKYYTDEGKDYYSKVTELKKKYSFKTGKWIDFLDVFVGIDDTHNYIFATKHKYLNIYDYSNYIEINPKRNCYFIDGVNNILEVSNAKSYYNIFSKIPRSEQIDSLGNKQFEDIEAIKWIIEHGVMQVLQMIKGGISKTEKFIQKDIEHWAVNPASYFSKGIIEEYGLKPTGSGSVKDIAKEGYLYHEFFNVSSQYRKQLLDGMCLILIKYGVEFDIHTGVYITDIYTFQFSKLIT